MSEIEALRAFENFLKTVTEWDEEAFHAAQPFFGIRHLKKGDYFVEADKTCRYFGFIAKGLMRAYLLLDGDEVTTCFCSENTFATSTTSFITQTPSSVSIQAMEDTVLLTISWDHLHQLYKQYPFWMKVGMIIIEKEFMSLECQRQCYDTQAAEDRYMLLMKENPGIVNRIPLQYIASYLGITPETLSRIRKRTAHRIS
ncbi:MAG: Crp/Fnr family transcriptional regulator [Bacteroidetes bacterium]|nr:Crp/Fnr family transcriptional regulator [Bacteroidota bacterium]